MLVGSVPCSGGFHTELRQISFGHRCLIERAMLGHEFLKLIVTGMRARTGHLYSVNSFVRAFPFSMAIIRNCSKTLSWIAGVSESDDTLMTFIDRIGTTLRVLEGIKADYRTSSEQAPPWAGR